MSNDWENLPQFKFEGDLKFSDENSENKSGNSEDGVARLNVNFENLENKKIKKYTLMLSILFFIIVIPIMWHHVNRYYRENSDMRKQQTLEVKVKNFSKQVLYNSIEATGLITAESSVDVVARVDGYLQSTHFKEGDFVKKGQLLFQIEPEEYNIAVRAAEASVQQQEAIYKNSLQELDRAKELIAENFISRSDYDSIVATANMHKASIDEVKQSLARAKLDLKYTKIYSPLTGKAGKIALSDGNYVSLSSGPLVNIAKTHPVSASFSLKSADVIKMKTSNEGVFDLSNAKVTIILSDNSTYEHVGKINFSNNFVAEDAATLSVKAVFDNPDNILVPGDYVKVVVTSATPENRILVPQSITRGDSLNGYYLWAVDKTSKTRKVPIKVLSAKENMWIVESGLTETDDIIYSANGSIDVPGETVVVKK